MLITWYRHRYLPCYTYYLISDTCHACHLILILVHAMLYLLFDIWYRYLPCLSLDIDTGTCHAMLITWYLIPVHTMLYLTLDIWHRYLPYLTLDIWRQYLPCYTWHLTCYHLVLIHLTWYCDTWLVTVIPNTCITLHIHDYHFYGDLSWLLYCYQTLVLLNSCAPELLKKGNSWYYTPVDPHNWITMNIGLL